MKHDAANNQVAERAGGATHFFPLLVAVCLSAGLLLPASAATIRTWTGTINPFWSEPGNWAPQGTPQTGDSLIFPPSATRYDSLNDLTNQHFGSIVLSGGGYYLTGGTVFLDSVLSDTHSTTASNRIYFMTYFTGAGLIAVSGAQQGSLLELYGQVRLNGNTNLTLLVTAFNGSGQPGFLTLRDAIVSSGAVYIQGGGVVYFRNGNPNVYYGGTHVLEGTLHLLGNKSQPADPGGTLVIGSNGVSQATVYVGPTPWAGDVRIVVNGSHLVFLYDTGAKWLELREGALVDGPGALTIYGGIESDSDFFTSVINLPLNIYPAFTSFYIHGSKYGELDIQTSIGGPGGISKNGESPLLLQHSNSFAGNISLYGGSIEAYGATSLGAGTNITMYGTGSLTLRNAAVGGKTLDAYTAEFISPAIYGGTLTSIGSSSWNGPIVLHTNLVVLGNDLTFNGPISGPGGMVFLNGIFTIGGGEANTFTGPTVVRCELLQFNKTTGVKAFSGPLVVGGPFSGPFEARWLQNYQNVYADVTLYTNGIVNLNHRREDFGPIHFNGGSILTGSGELGVYDVVMVNAANVSASISGNLGLPAGYREFRVADGSALMDLQINATVLGPGHLHKTGPGQMWLNVANTYSGLTLVGEGTLVANAIGALGSPTTGTVVLEGSTLAFNFLNTTINELISLRGAGAGGISGALNVQGTAILRSQFPSIYACLDLTTNATIRVEAGSQLTGDGFISGVGPLNKTGGGTMIFSSSYGNTYSGATQVKEGTLTLQKPVGVTAIPGNVSIGSGPGGPAATLLQQASFSIIGQVTVNGGGLWNLTGYAEGFSSTAPPPLTLNDGGTVQSGSSGIVYLPVGGDVVVNPGTNTCTIGGNVGFDAGAHHFVVGNGGGLGGFGPGLLITAPIGQTGGDAWFQKDGPGFMRINNTSSLTGTNVIAAGRFSMQGSQSSGGVQINSGARLEGLGGGSWRMIMNGGTVAPGPLQGGVLQSGTFNEGGGSGTLQLQLDSITPGLSNTKLNVFGNVNLNGLNLSLLVNFVPPTNALFVLLENTSAGSTTGTFNGLPQNAILYAGGRAFRIDYAGKTGNDVVLTDLGGVFQPVLTIERSTPNAVRLLWPTNDPGFGLQSNTNLLPATWQSVAGTPGVLGTNYVVTNNVVGAQKLFRLVKP